ncbi:hypothetical protein SAM23877_6128 [Streptomyces ambofaciens ATCC 23877]|uniref:Uncharacterized protein n=1 Tax=Streptomyces ambofaciens (strain ATCC 23877 / 3486 / DSM 40053 / JCM 4204 / NBRC 12836 / NRRL B-2516) TaxID=278992 RepID=A0A0K2B1U1_STRA7|nr:hypothetical protein [Streptomyces ambofaciens]AKZ59173.1 hypothetical protein SAM23877_6128 [Streptomyces ambofaciens ATCC 23877]WNA15366.1 hypothetical protein SAMYPH_35 [Streptomyces phage Samy]
MSGTKSTYLGHETTLTEYTDPVRVELTTMGRGPVAMEENSSGQRWTFDIPGMSWYALRGHIRDTDPVRAELEKSLDDARSTIERLSDDRDHWEQEAESRQKEADLWKSLAARQDNTAPLRTELDSVKRERDYWHGRFEGAQANAEYVREQYGRPDEVDELKAVIVSQAREIARLKGESE